MCYTAGKSRLMPCLCLLMLNEYMHSQLKFDLGSLIPVSAPLRHTHLITHIFVNGNVRFRIHTKAYTLIYRQRHTHTHISMCLHIYGITVKHRQDKRDERWEQGQWSLRDSMARNQTMKITNINNKNEKKKWLVIDLFFFSSFCFWEWSEILSEIISLGFSYYSV